TTDPRWHCGKSLSSERPRRNLLPVPPPPYSSDGRSAIPAVKGRRLKLRYYRNLLLPPARPSGSNADALPRVTPITIRQGSRALRRQSVALGAGRRDRPDPLARPRALRIARPNELSADGRRCLPCDARALWILLVPAARTGGVDGRQPEDLGGIRNACPHQRLE